MTQPAAYSPSAQAATPAMQAVRRAEEQLNGVILGKRRQVSLALACILAQGHLLIEDQPGVGKTTLAGALARTLGLGFQRVQFTSDLLPADLLGVSIWDAPGGTFRFHEGPIFTSVLLADEINRATPKTQGALLEAMEERQVSEGGVTRPLPHPFFVIATQNPAAFVGTSPLPEAQLDRFLFTLTLGYPGPQAERELLETGGRGRSINDLPAVMDPAALLQAQAEAAAIHTAGPLLDYLQLLTAATRQHPDLETGLSPRALLGLQAAARAWAYLQGRTMALPEDVQAVFPALARHRLPPAGPHPVADTIQDILESTPLP